MDGKIILRLPSIFLGRFMDGREFYLRIAGNVVFAFQKLQVFVPRPSLRSPPTVWVLPLLARVLLVSGIKGLQLFAHSGRDDAAPVHL